MMSDEWPLVPLGTLAASERASVAIGPFGSRMKASNYESSGVAVIRGQNLTARGQICGPFVYVSQAFAATMGSALLREGDIVLPHRGAIGRAALVPHGEFLMSTSLMRVRVRNEVALPEFVVHYLCSDGGSREILRFASTVGTPGIGQPLTSLNQMRIPLPPIDEQRRIAGVLGALDDLIDTNESTARSMEDLLAAQFARLGFDRDGELQLSELVVLNPGYPKPRGQAPYVDMRALPTDGYSIKETGSRSAVGGARFANGDTLVARITPCLENGKTAFVDCLLPGEIGVGSTEFIVMKPRVSVAGCWPYFLARSDRFREYAIRHMTGTSGRQRLAAEALASYPIAQPSSASLAEFSTLSTPLLAAMRSLLDEARVLRRTRDELLPLLMSGRVRVRDLESA